MNFDENNNEEILNEEENKKGHTKRNVGICVLALLLALGMVKCTNDLLNNKDDENHDLESPRPSVEDRFETPNPTPIVTDEPVVTPTPTAEPTAEPTPTQIVEPTTSPAVTDKPVNTKNPVEPTKKPVETTKPVVSPTPIVTNEPVVTPTPTAEPTAEPTVTPIPVVKMEEPIVKYSTKELTNEGVQVTITSNVPIQGIEDWTLSLDKKTLTRLFNDNRNYDVTIKSESGESKTVHVKINNIDKTFATPTITYSTTELTNENVVVIITSTEEMRPLSGWTLSSDKKSMTKSFSSNKEVNMYVSDLAGNRSLLNIKVSNIDKTFRTPTVSYKKESSKRVLVTIESREEMQPLSGWTLSSDKKSMTKTYTSNKEEKITVKDLAGNTATLVVKVTGISYSNDRNPSTTPSPSPSPSPEVPGDDNDRENTNKDDLDNDTIGEGNRDDSVIMDDEEEEEVTPTPAPADPTQEKTGLSSIEREAQAIVAELYARLNEEKTLSLKL